MDPCAGVFARETVRVVAVRHGDVDCGGNPVGEARQVQCARVREDALAPSAGYRGELVVEHVGGAVDAPRELVYGTRFQGVRNRAGQEPRLRDLRRAGDAALALYEFGYLLASAHVHLSLITEHIL